MIHNYSQKGFWEHKKEYGKKIPYSLNFNNSTWADDPDDIHRPTD